MSTIDQHSVFAQLSTGTVLDVTRGSATLDEAWAPFAQVSLTCALPASATREEIDPRKDVRLRMRIRQDFAEPGSLSDLSDLWAGKTLGASDGIAGGPTLAALSGWDSRAWNSFGARPTTSRWFDLGIRSRPFVHEDGTVTLVATTDEALLQDHRYLGNAPLRPAALTVRDLCEWVLRRIRAALPAGAADAPLAPTAGLWLPGVTAWDFLSPILQQAGLRLWCDGFRIWHLEERIVSSAGGNVQLSYLGTVTGATDDISRDGNDWYDAVQVTYKWTDSWGIQQVAYDFASLSGWSKALAIEYSDTPYPGPGAAQRVLDRALGRGRVLTVRAVSDYSVEPAASATVTLDGTPVQTGYVSSVEWAFPDAEMTVKTRGLIDTPAAAWVRLPAGQKWLDSPVGASWISEVVS